MVGESVLQGEVRYPLLVKAHELVADDDGRLCLPDVERRKRRLEFPRAGNSLDLKGNAKSLHTGLDFAKEG
jgi:hypothetical protein